MLELEIMTIKWKLFIKVAC